MQEKYVAILSPAKSLLTEVSQKPEGIPQFLDRAEVVHDVLKKKSVRALEKLHSVSRKIAEENYVRNARWKKDAHADEGTPAIFTFSGDVYQGFDAWTLDEQGVKAAQDRLLILSGLYGMLRPMDAMMPYRLEMGTPITIARKKGLPAYWKKDVTSYINTHYAGRTLINLASGEYFSVIDKKKLALPVIEPVFKDFSKGEFKVISFHAKKARGMFARFMVENECQKREDFQGFTMGGYYYDANTSTEDRMVFLRA